MKIARSILLLTLLLLSGPSLGATARELDSAELRQMAQGGEIISLKRVIDSVAMSTGGEPIEARAFALDGVFYRIVVKQPDGAVVSVIVNAQTGDVVAKGSAVGKQVAAAAKAGSRGKSTKGKSQSAGSNSNAGGNGNGNGNGNGGGNGNGNGGGNGGGNGNN